MRGNQDICPSPKIPSLHYFKNTSKNIFDQRKIKSTYQLNTSIAFFFFFKQKVGTFLIHIAGSYVLHRKKPFLVNKSMNILPKFMAGSSETKIYLHVFTCHQQYCQKHRLKIHKEKRSERQGEIHLNTRGEEIIKQSFFSLKVKKQQKKMGKKWTK